MKLHKDHIKFLVFLGIVIILTRFLLDIITRSWNTELMKQISEGIRSIDPNGTSIFMSITIGFYVGSAILLIIDRYKRIQAVILSIGILIITNQMSSIFNVHWNIIYIGLGSIIGIYLGGGFDGGFALYKNKQNFKKATKSVSYISVSYIIISFLILYASPDQNNGNFIKDSIVVMSFSYFFGEIMNISVQGPKIFILGPGKSGKTLFLAGCYMRVLSITEIPVKPSEDLVNLIGEMHLEGIEWPGQTLGTIKEYEFSYETGRIFPKETTLRTVDYPGPFIEKIADYMDTKIGSKGIKLSEEEIKYATVAQAVSKADKLILVIDGGRYPNFGDMGMMHYIKIISKLHEKGREIEPYIVVTKSDLFINEYPNYEADYEGFKKFIEDKFSQNISLRMLLNEASNASFYPVFYYTKRVPNTLAVPIRDENRNVYTFGFDKFMNRLMDID